MHLGEAVVCGLARLRNDVGGPDVGGVMLVDGREGVLIADTGPSAVMTQVAAAVADARAGRFEDARLRCE